MNIEASIVAEISKAFDAVFSAKVAEQEIQLQPTRKDFEGEYTFVSFPFLRVSRKSPEETGTALGEFLVENSELISKFNVVKGFLNLSVSDKTWSSRLNDLVKENLDHQPDGDEIMVEYSSPNTNKPLHLGHLRNIFLGWSVSKILSSAGKHVHRVQIINDRGIHICKSMVAWDRYGNGATPESEGMKGDKFIGEYYVRFDQEHKKEIAELVKQGMSEEQASKEAPIFQEAQGALIKWEQKDEEVYGKWQKMNSWVYSGFDQTYDTMGVVFDKLYYESDTYKLGRDIVLKGVEKGVFFKKDDGSVWVDLTDEGLDEKLLLRSDGTSVYMTQDIGTAILRFQDFPKISNQVYTVGNEQEYHFKVLFLILKKLGYEWADENYHLSYGMVDLPTGKMKSREGTVVDADDLMEEVIEKAKEQTQELGKVDELGEGEADNLYRQLGLGALKYFLLKIDPKRRILFNPEESVDLHGHTGPFIQYTHARINSLLRKAEQLKISYKEGAEAEELTEIERNLVFSLSNYKNRVIEAGREYSPALIAAYVYDLAKDYNKLWQNVVILKEENTESRKFRLMISEQVAKTIAHGLDLLGVESPKRM